MHQIRSQVPNKLCETQALAKMHYVGHMWTIYTIYTRWIMWTNKPHKPYEPHKSYELHESHALDESHSLWIICAKWATCTLYNMWAGRTWCNIHMIHTSNAPNELHVTCQPNFNTSTMWYQLSLMHRKASHSQKKKESGIE